MSTNSAYNTPLLNLVRASESGTDPRFVHFHAPRELHSLIGRIENLCKRIRGQPPSQARNQVQAAAEHMYANMRRLVERLDTAELQRLPIEENEDDEDRLTPPELTMEIPPLEGLSNLPDQLQERLGQIADATIESLAALEGRAAPTPNRALRTLLEQRMQALGGLLNQIAATPAARSYRTAQITLEHDRSTLPNLSLQELLDTVRSGSLEQAPAAPASPYAQLSRIAAPNRPDNFGPLALIAQSLLPEAFEAAGHNAPLWMDTFRAIQQQGGLIDVELVFTPWPNPIAPYESQITDPKSCLFVGQLPAGLSLNHVAWLINQAYGEKVVARADLIPHVGRAAQIWVPSEKSADIIEKLAGTVLVDRSGIWHGRMNQNTDPLSRAIQRRRIQTLFRQCRDQLDQARRVRPFPWDLPSGSLFIEPSRHYADPTRRRAESELWRSNREV